MPHRALAPGAPWATGLVARWPRRAGSSRVSRVLAVAQAAGAQGATACRSRKGTFAATRASSGRAGCSWGTSRGVNGHDARKVDTFTLRNRAFTQARASGRGVSRYPSPKLRTWRCKDRLALVD